MSKTKKQCSKCSESKDLIEFQRNRNSKDGLRPHCKTCAKFIYQQNKDIISLKSKEYYLKNKVSRTEYRKNNKESLNKNDRVRYAKDINYRLARTLRTRIRKALQGNFKKGSAIRDLGCSIEELKVHLESKFQEGMTWNNYGYYGWHIDHIKPLSLFDLTNEEELKQSVHYTNLQPLWAEDNIEKGNKVRK